MPQKASVSCRERASKPKGTFKLQRVILSRSLSLGENTVVVLKNHTGDLDAHWYLLGLINGNCA